MLRRVGAKDNTRQRKRPCFRGLLVAGAGFGHISPTISRTALRRSGCWNRAETPLRTTGVLLVVQMSGNTREVAPLERAILLHHLMKNLNSAFEFPKARRDPNSGYTLHGRWFNDPYEWLERLDDPETEAWIAAQEAVTHSVLSGVPGRDWLRAAVTRSRRYAQLSGPIPAGPNGREFLWQADASDEKLKFMLRRGKDAPLETVLDPNTWASDEVLVFAVPSPDGTLVAFGKSVGSAHDAVT